MKIIRGATARGEGKRIRQEETACKDGCGVTAGRYGVRTWREQIEDSMKRQREDGVRRRCKDTTWRGREQAAQTCIA